jgi:hypothetical protein
MGGFGIPYWENHLRKTTGLILLAVLFCLVPPTRLSAQSLRKSHGDCIKLVPGDWGPNFGERWKQNEAVYWGCRLGIPAETIKEWQHFASGAVQDLIPVTIDNQQIVLMEDMEGSAPCYTISALMKTSKGWELAWSRSSNPDSMDHCTLSCPPIRMRVQRRNLTLELPATSDPKEDQTLSCKHIKWQKETYHWDGKTFQAATVH